MLYKVNEDHVFSDTTLQLLCSQIDSDYTAILRRDVLPKLKMDRNVRLREIRTLMILDSFERPAPSAIVAHYLRFDKGTVSRAVKILKDQNYVRCLPNPADKRSPLLHVTKQGHSLASDYTAAVNEHFSFLSEHVGRGLSEEERQVVLKALYLLRDRTKVFAGHPKIA